MIRELLLAPVDDHLFTGSADWPTMLAVLQSHKESTAAVPISSFADVAIQSNYRLRGLWRFTRPALTRYCRDMCPGLSSLVFNLLDDPETSESDAQAVVDVVNRIAQARAQRFKGYSWLIDTVGGRVLGLVSARYRMTYSFDLMEHVHDYVLQTQRLGFFDARLHHRKIDLRFIGRQAAFTLPVASAAEQFYSGFFFANSEVGDCSIRAAPQILRGATGGSAVAPQTDEGGSLRHLKAKNFNRKLHELLDRTLLSAAQLRDYRETLLRMRTTQLGFTLDAKQQQVVLTHLADRLQSGGLTRGFAESLINAMVLEGSYKVDRVPPGGAILQATSRRTFYDLWNALTVNARRQTASGDREIAEHLAFKMLTGKFLFTRKGTS